jgi:hypothetical protein
MVCPRCCVGILVLSMLLVPLVTSARSQCHAVNHSVDTLPPPGKRFALLIGVSRYRHNISPLDGPANDVQKLQSALVDFAGFDPSHIKILSSESSDQNDLPTKDNIIAALNHMQSDIAGGLLLVAFSGHGVFKFGVPYLLTYETVPDNSFDIAETAASNEWLKRKLATINAKDVILLLDSCQNDPDVAKSLSDDSHMSPEFKAAFDMLVTQPNQAGLVLYATSPPHKAYINDDKLGFFTAAVTEGLSGKASKNGTAAVTLGDLIDYVKQTVPSKVKSERNAVQDPSDCYDRYDLSAKLVEPGLTTKQDPAAQRFTIHVQHTGARLDCFRLPLGSTMTIKSGSFVKHLDASSSCDLSFLALPRDLTQGAVLSLSNSDDAQLLNPQQTYDFNNTRWPVDVVRTDPLRISAFDLQTSDHPVTTGIDFYGIASQQTQLIISQLLSLSPALGYLSRVEFVKTNEQAPGSAHDLVVYAEKTGSFQMLTGVETIAGDGPNVDLLVFTPKVSGQPTGQFNIGLSLRSQDYPTIKDAFSALLLSSLLNEARIHNRGSEVTARLRDAAYTAVKQAERTLPAMSGLEAGLTGAN